MFNVWESKNVFGELWKQKKRWGERDTTSTRLVISRSRVDDMCGSCEENTSLSSHLLFTVTFFFKKEESNRFYLLIHIELGANRSLSTFLPDLSSLPFSRARTRLTEDLSYHSA